MIQIQEPAMCLVGDPLTDARCQLHTGHDGAHWGHGPFRTWNYVQAPGGSEGLRTPTEPAVPVWSRAGEKSGQLHPSDSGARLPDSGRGSAIGDAVSSVPNDGDSGQPLPLRQFRCEVIADYVLFGARLTAHNDVELLAAIEGLSRRSPIARVSVRFVSPPAVDAVDPQASSTGKPSTREKTS